MSTKRNEQNYAETPINDGQDYIMAVDRMAEERSNSGVDIIVACPAESNYKLENDETYKSIIGNTKRAFADTTSSEDIDKLSKTILLETDEDAYGLSNAKLTFCPGKLNGSIIKRDFDHMLVTGRTGTGKTIFVRNIIEQLVLRYGAWQVHLNVWDGLGSEFVRHNAGAEFVDIHGVSSNASECSLIHYLRDRVETLRDRLSILSSAGYNTIEELNKSLEGVHDIRFPVQVILLEEYGIGLNVREDIKEEVLYLIHEILRDGKRAGMYLIISNQPTDVIDNVFRNYFNKNGYVFATRLSDMESSIIFGNNIATESEVGRYGSVIMREPGMDVIKLEVPFYADNKVRSICYGEILPMGQRFSNFKLQQLYRMHCGIKN